MIFLLGFIAFCLFAPLLVLKLLLLAVKVLELAVLGACKLLIGCLNVLIWLVSKIEGCTLSLSAQYNGNSSTVRWYKRYSLAFRVYKTVPALPNTPYLSVKLVKTRL